VAQARDKTAATLHPRIIGDALRRLCEAHAAAFIFERTLYFTACNLLLCPYVLFIMDKSEEELRLIFEEMDWWSLLLYACPIIVGFQVIESLRKKLQLVW
jgi:hypothetical protein